MKINFISRICRLQDVLVRMADKFLRKRQWSNALIALLSFWPRYLEEKQFQKDLRTLAADEDAMREDLEWAELDLS